ncbi:cellulase family glycosylhydrolase [Mycobacterium sp. AZCC_0083]|uniref:cellulase family glycosylhydrolase n=1 Tax=Mycobacterium sp. AZCC_0083 TaxID=2735882 RepID=UPI0016156B95|nr:cellulase family glycosylhydrolase [Mycobacterium sp. AZCC_0083]MBB5160154.1 hypothetical protein [Mycobacterium sp. AZCC_0083]
MNKCRGTLFRAIATRAVIAVIPAAMVSAYASGIFVAPPRMAAYEYVQVAEITDTPNTIGMAESPLYGMSQADIDATLDQLQSIGVQNIRVFVPWGLIEQTDNTYDFSLLDKVMSAAAARNMGVMAEINGTPSWAGPNPGNPGFPPGSDTPNVAAFTDFLNKLMAHQVAVPGAVLPVSYASIVSAYEIWNEPNSFMFSNPISPEDYATLLKAAYAAINNVVTGDPTATVVAGAVGATQTFGGFTMDPVTFVTRMLAALGTNPEQYFDALSVHPYGDQIPFSGTCPSCGAFLTPREQVEAIMNLIPDKQVWLTEYGVSSTDAASAATQAAWIKDLLDTWQAYADPNSPFYNQQFAEQIGPIFLYTGRDTAGSTDPGANMGIWTSVGGEKVYVDSNGVSHTVSEMLKDWIAAHPMPTTPGIPGIPILNPIAALVQALVSGVQGFVTAVVTAITNFLSGIAGVLSGPAAAAAAPLALRSASVVSAETEGLAAESDATAADGKGADATEKTATVETATETTATEVTAAEETATAETPAESTETAALPAVTATETAVATATETAVPVKVTEPVTVTEPVKTEPVKTEPTGTTGTTTETGSTGTSTGSTTPESSTGSKSDESDKPSDSDKSGESTKSGSSKSGESTKSGASEGQSKSGKDGNEGSGSRTRGKDGSGSGEVKAKPVAVTAGVGAAGAEGGEGASDSAGGAAS